MKTRKWTKQTTFPAPALIGGLIHSTLPTNPTCGWLLYKVSAILCLNPLTEYSTHLITIACDIQKNYDNLQDMIHLTPELKFIWQCSQQNWAYPFPLFNNPPTSGQNGVIQCENDADTSIVKVGLIDETDDPFEVSIYHKVTKFSGILNLAILAFCFFH